MGDSLTEPLTQSFPHPDSVQVLCINLFLRPPFIHNNLGDLKDERTQYFCEHILPRYDIVCLQEVFGTLNPRKERIIAAGRAAGLKHCAKSPAPGFWSSYVTDGGLLILSRFPIVTVQFRPFGFGTFPDSLAKKGVLYAEILISAHTLHLFTTHTQAVYLTSDPEQYRLYRSVTRQHIELLAQFMSEKLHSPGMIMLAGDLNVDALEHQKDSAVLNEGMDEYQILRKTLEPLQMREVLKDIYETHPVTYGKKGVDGQPEETVLTHVEDQGNECALDYIFTVNEGNVSYKQGLQVEAENTRVEAFYTAGQPFTQISDHHGLHIGLRVDRSR